MSQNKSLQAELTSVFQQQLAAYKRALALLETIQDAFVKRVDAERELVELNRIMNQIAEQDAATSDLRQQVLTKPENLPPELNQLIVELRVTIESMLLRVNVVEDMAKKSRDTLLPQISQQVTAKRMLSAYQPG